MATADTVIIKPRNCAAPAHNQHHRRKPEYFYPVSASCIRVQDTCNTEPQQRQHGTRDREAEQRTNEQHGSVRQREPPIRGRNQNCISVLDW